jgi:hypothetical protein
MNARIAPVAAFGDRFLVTEQLLQIAAPPESFDTTQTLGQSFGQQLQSFLITTRERVAQCRFNTRRFFKEVSGYPYT